MNLRQQAQVIEDLVGIDKATRFWHAKNSMLESALRHLGPAWAGGRIYDLRESHHRGGLELVELVGEPDDRVYATLRITLNPESTRYDMVMDWHVDPVTLEPWSDEPDPLA